MPSDLAQSRFLLGAGAGAADRIRERPRAAADKGENAADQPVVCTFSLDARQPVAKHAAAEVRQRSLRHTPRNDVGANAAHSHDHRALPDPNELPNGSLAAEKTVVADADVAADHGIIGEGNV